MIYLYSGTPGSGKSLHATMKARDNVIAGRPVIANYALNFPKAKHRALFRCWDNLDVTPDALVDFATDWWSTHPFKEESIRLILDECQLIFNSRSWDSKGAKGKDGTVSGPSRMDWIRFFSQHRKYGYSVILVAQSDRMIDRQIRSLIEYEYLHRKVSNFGWRGWLLSLALGGTNTFICSQRYYGLHEYIGRDIFHARKKIFQLYDTRATFQGDGASVARDGSPTPRDGGLHMGDKGGPMCETSPHGVGRHYARLGVS